MRIVFFGTPAFALPSLTALLHAGEEVVAVVTQPDKRKGRGHSYAPPPVKAHAIEKGIQVLQPIKIDDSTVHKLSILKPEVIVVVAYGKILRAPILMLPSYGCINIHASLLPKYRGAAPIQWAIINGEKKTGITTMIMDEGLDTGDILLQEETDISDDDTAETLGKRLADLGASVLLKTLQGLAHGTVSPAPQVGVPSFAPSFKKEDGMIDWEKTARALHNFIRGMYPWPCAYCYLNKERIKIIKAKVLEGSGLPRRIEKTENELIVGTGEEEKRLKKKVHKLNLNRYCCFIGHVDQVQPYYQACDVILIPSLFEGFCFTAIEAQLLERPVIAFSISSLPEVIQHNHTGFLIPLCESRYMAVKLRLLFDHADLRRRMGRQGKEFIENNFSAIKIYDQLENLFCSLVKPAV